MRAANMARRARCRRADPLGGSRWRFSTDVGATDGLLSRPESSFCRTGHRRRSTSARSTSRKNGCRVGSEAAAAFSTTSSPTSSIGRGARTATTGGGLAAPPRERQVERVDVTQFFSDATREPAAARRAHGARLGQPRPRHRPPASRCTAGRRRAPRARADRRRSRTRSPRRSRRRRTTRSAPTLRRRSRPTRKLRCSPRTRSPASSARRTSGRSTCSSRSLATPSRTRVSCSSASASRTRSSAAQ